MRKLWLLVLLSGRVVFCLAQSAGFGVEGMASVVVPVTMNKMTNIVFPERVETGVKVSRDVLVQKVRGVENVIELKAVRRDFAPTNISVYGRDGRLYSFVLRYVLDTAVLNFRVVPDGGGAPVLLSGLPVGEDVLRDDSRVLVARRGFLHVSRRTERLRLRLTGVYLRDSLEWLVFRIADRSEVAFHAGMLRFVLQDTKQVKRKAEQERPVSPVFGGLPLVGGEDRTGFAVGFEPFTVPRGKRLLVQVAGQDGDRVVELRVKGKILLKARREER